MMWILSWIVRAIVVYASAYLVSGVHVQDFMSALLASIVLALVNTFIRPILKVLTLPITLLTLGLFSLIINALMIMLVDVLVPGFVVDGFVVALIYSIVLSVLMWVVNLFTNR